MHLKNTAYKISTQEGFMRRFKEVLLAQDLCITKSVSHLQRYTF